MQTRRPRQRFLFELAFVLALPILAQGGLLDGWLDRDDGGSARAVYFDREPSLVFGAGTLALDAVGRWTVGGLSLTFDGESKIRQGGRKLDARSLRLGQNAVVTGSRLGDGSIRVRRLSVRTTAQNIGNIGGDGSAEDVGELPADVPN